MTDSENKEKWISIPYLPPPLGSLQAGGLKADNSHHPPLEVDWGVEGVFSFIIRNLGVISLARLALDTNINNNTKTMKN